MPENGSGVVVCSSFLLLCGHPGRRQAETPLIQPVQKSRASSVDKFQGQEAEAVIVSMATSGAEDMPRDAAFLLSRNRFNVAISRARCLAVLVASPGLLDIVANSIDEMRLANPFCWAADYASSSI